MNKPDIQDFCYDNKYTKWYFSIINSALNRNTTGYKERHHILPKSIVSNNNVVNLTAREHYICHLLLPKMLKEEKHRRKMWLALHRLIHGNSNNDLKCISSKLYETIKIEHSKSCSVRSKLFWSNLTEEEKRKLRPSGKDSTSYGHQVSSETRNKISQKAKERLAIKENHPLYNKGHSFETKERMSRDARESERNKGSNNPMFGKPGAATGKKWYHNPETGEERYFVIGHQQINFVPGRLKRVA